MGQPVKWEKIFLKYIRNSYNSIVNKPSNLQNRGTEHTFSQRRHTDGQQVQETMLNITRHQGNAIKDKMRYYLIPVTMVIINKERRK